MANVPSSQTMFMQYKDHGYWVTSAQGPQVSQVLMGICMMEWVCSVCV